ncbi:MAG TPA: hypothetical protein DCR93_17565 [Cytophagales bacterium]|nr:hypothetical protein [Cytophagales bacterium]HAP61220.1 hypothetical protein [Cytophagales bacterium]
MLVSTTPLFAQSYAEYEPSAQHPYGRPNPEAPEAVNDFAPMIGRSVCQSQTRNPDQSWNAPQEMIWTFKYIMNGMAVQDETLKEDGSHSGSIRQYIPDSARWYVHYYSSGAPTPTLPAWEGTVSEAKDKLVLYRPQQAPNGMDGYSRLTFSSFTEDGFEWVGEWVDPAEQFVYPTWKISCRQKQTGE